MLVGHSYRAVRLARHGLGGVLGARSLTRDLELIPTALSDILVARLIVFYQSCIILEDIFLV
jgi:hypothetical protein